jgi:hypothetical protein
MAAGTKAPTTIAANAVPAVQPGNATSNSRGMMVLPSPGTPAAGSAPRGVIPSSTAM